MTSRAVSSANPNDIFFNFYLLCYINLNSKSSQHRRPIKKSNLDSQIISEIMGGRGAPLAACFFGRLFFVKKREEIIEQFLSPPIDYTSEECFSVNKRDSLLAG
ncbi:hypothetical protein CW304_20225 [Bacillus sp. UFRGS-B20]|nr:hypothetical protein CW304_20225 [Bacillus sp. UFRGS-B20]